MAVLQTIRNYVDGCLSGAIPVCKWVKFACERHNKDLTRDDIYFDENAAQKAIDFIQLMRHVKGKLAGSKLHLEPWQVFFVGSIFGWMRVDTGLRRFREAHAEVPRKSGKSLELNGIGHYGLVADNEKGAEIILAAAKEDQAKDIFGVALQMVNTNPSFRKYYGLQTTTEIIRHPSSGSYFKFVVGSPVDGSNPHFGLIDEYHQHKSAAAYDAIKLGMGAREQPLLIVMSTAGVDFKCAYKRYVYYCRKVVSGVVEDDSLFTLEYTIDEEDNWEDFSVWKKANPNMGISVSEDFLRGQHAKALADVSSRSAILTKHLNVWNNSSTSWIDLRKWMACGQDQAKMDDFTGEACWVGLDLASRIDLCSLMFVFRRDDKYYVFGKHYLNRDRVDRAENKHLRTWEEEGWLTVTDGAQTDFGYIENDLRDLSNQFRVQELAYDPREATYLMQQVREWASFPCIEVSQGPINFSEPMKVLEAKYLSGELVHANDPVLCWAASNVILKNTSNKLFYPAKRTNEEKIDPIVALIMALGRAETAHKAADFSFFVL